MPRPEKMRLKNRRYLDVFCFWGGLQAWDDLWAGLVSQ